MADRVISEIGTHGRGDMAEKPGITRRKLLRALPKVAAVAATATVVGVGGLGLKGIVDNLSQIGAIQESNNSLKFKPVYVLEDEVDVFKGFQLFSEPIVSVENPGKYVITPGEIIKIGDLNVRGLDKFVVRKGLTVKAQNPVAPSGEQSDWIRVRTTRDIGGSPLETHGYLDLSIYSSRFVKRIIDKGFVPIIQTKEGLFKTADGKTTYNPQEVSVVTPE